MYFRIIAHNDWFYVTETSKNKIGELKWGIIGLFECA
jgi:hypothetical protein